MSNSAVFFVPAARCCARVLLVSFPYTPTRGERSAERRSISVVARFGARRSAPGEARRASSGTRSPLGAPPWRFWAGGRASFSGISSGSVQRAPRSQVLYRVPKSMTLGPFPNGSESDSRRRTEEVRHVGSDTVTPGFWCAAAARFGQEKQRWPSSPAAFGACDNL